MIRIVHLSDVHWRGISRHAEYVDAFERFFKLLKDELKPDLIINTGDFYHSKTACLTPEIIEKLCWAFNGLASIAPTLSILGNHDSALMNPDRQDIISSVHNAINNPNAVLLKKSGTYDLKTIFSHNMFKCQNEYSIHVYSPTDILGWSNIALSTNKINIALYHGSIVGCETDLNFRMREAERDVSFFKGHDFVLLGDIHRAQFLDYKRDKNNILKPYIGYAGSFRQQNYGEAIEKGFLVWDIHSRDDWDIKFVEIENKEPFVTAKWSGSVNATIKEIKKIRGDKINNPNTRYRIVSTKPIQQIEVRQLVTELREKYRASEVVFKSDFISKMETVETAGQKILKTDLRNDPQAILNFYKEHAGTHQDLYVLGEKQLNEVDATIRSYLNRLSLEDSEITARNVNWSIKSLEFDNIFRYGDGNKIDFEKLNGIVGIFANNRAGKSSIIAALTYALFNTTDRGPMKSAHIINKLKNQCSAKLTINVGGHDYVIERETVRSLPKNSGRGRKRIKEEQLDKTVTSLNLHRIDSDSSDIISLNSITRDDTDKEIRKLVGTSSDFLLTALANQGGINRFIEEGATARKAILSRFLDLDIFEKLYTYAKDDFSFYEDKTKKYSTTDWNSTLRVLKAEIKEFELQILDIEKQIKVKTKEKDDLKIWLIEHNKLASIVDYDKIANLKEEVTGRKEEIKQLASDNTKAEKDKNRLSTKLTKFVQKLAKYNISQLNEEINSINMLKTNINEYSNKLVSEELSLSGQEKSIRKLSIVPCKENEYPSCPFIVDSHRSKHMLPKQQLIVKELREALNTYQTKMDEYVKKRTTENLAKYQTLEKQIFELKTEFETAKSRVLEASRNLSDGRREFDVICLELNDLEVRAQNPELKKLEKNQTVYDTLVSAIEKDEIERRDLLVKLGGKTEQLNKLKFERSESKSDLAKLKLYDSIQSAFSKNGIPAMILKTQLPAINTELAKILDNVVDFKVTLETDTATSNIMDVYIEDNSSRRVIETSSGMEKMICSLALRVALLNLSSLPRPDIFIVDEGWSALDQESFAKLSSIFDMLKHYFRTVVIISHMQEAKEFAETILDISYGPLESFISYPPKNNIIYN